MTEPKLKTKIYDWLTTSPDMFACLSGKPINWSWFSWYSYLNSGDPPWKEMTPWKKMSTAEQMKQQQRRPFDQNRSVVTLNHWHSNTTLKQQHSTCKLSKPTSKKRRLTMHNNWRYANRSFSRPWHHPEHLLQQPWILLVSWRQLAHLWRSIDRWRVQPLNIKRSNDN